MLSDRKHLKHSYKEKRARNLADETTALESIVEGMNPDVRIRGNVGPAFGFCGETECGNKSCLQELILYCC